MTIIKRQSELRYFSTLIKNCFRLITLISFTSVSYSPVYAFSEDGFYDGMAIDAVQNMLGREGSHLVAKHGTDNLVSYVADRGGHRQFNFCKDQLIGYSRTLSGFTEFNAVIARETKEFGEAHYDSSVSENIGGWAPPEEHNRAYSSLEFSWKTPEGVTGVRIFEMRGFKVFLTEKPRSPGDWILDIATNFSQYWGTGRPC